MRTEPTATPHRSRPLSDEELNRLPWNQRRPVMLWDHLTPAQRTAMIERERQESRS